MYRYQPDTAVPAGRDIRDWADEHGMLQVELATRLDLSQKALSQIITGKAPLSRHTADRLELVTGIPAEYWNKRELVYRDHLKRLQPTALVKDQVDWLACFDTNTLRKRGAITSTGRDRPQQYRELLRFFAVASPEAWTQVWRGPKAAFRRSQTFAASPHMTSAWLRFGELELSRPSVAYDDQHLRESLERLRALTRFSDQVYAARTMHCLLSDAGVALVFVPTLPRAPISGATRWLHDQPLIQMSDRFKTDDHFWFSFFHEVGHILEHPTRDTIEGADSPEVEAQADAFASQILIPGSAPRLRTLADVEVFAAEIGVAPGIVVGRLQHENRFPRKNGNRLKGRVTTLVHELTTLQRTGQAS